MGSFVGVFGAVKETLNVEMLIGRRLLLAEALRWALQVADFPLWRVQFSWPLLCYKYHLHPDFLPTQLPVPAVLSLCAGLFQQSPVFIGIAIPLMLQVCFIYLPPLQALFNSAPLDGRAWMFAMAVGVIVLPIISLDKWIRNHRSANSSPHTKEIR